MRRALGDRWFIDLSDVWARDGVTTWRAPGRTLHVAPGDAWRCADGVDIIATLDAELPPHPTRRLGEAGRGTGVGHRAAWLYELGGGAGFVLHGYHFTDDSYLETVLSGVGTADLGWAFDAWRSVSRAAPGQRLTP